MAFSNDEDFGKNGVSQEILIEYLIYLHGVIDGITAKLDADAGITDTDYQAAAQSELPATAGPTNGSTTVAAISTAVAAYS